MSSSRRAYRVLTAEAGASDSSAVVNINSEQLAGSYQLEVGTSVATFILQGRSDPDAPWETIVASITATGEGAIPRLYPQMRATWTTNAGVLDYWIVA